MTNYGTVDGFKAYAASRNWDAIISAGDDQTITAALLVASETLDNKYRDQFPGYKTLRRAQDREWPRLAAYDQFTFENIPGDQVPDEVERATYEFAKRELLTPGSLYRDFTLSTSLKAASVYGAVSVTYSGATSVDDAQLMIPVIAGILEPILSVQGGFSSHSGKVVRV